MSHRFADSCHRYILALGDTGPRVACHVGGEFGGQAQFFAQFFQVMVDEVYLILVLFGFVLTLARDDRK